MEVGFLTIKSFSVRHKFHVLAPGLYDWHFVSISQLIVYLISALPSLHIRVLITVEKQRLYIYIHLTRGGGGGGESGTN